MVWKKVAGGTAFWNFNEKKALEGLYVKNHPGKYGTLYDVKTSDAVVTVPSSRTLDPLMANVPVGSTIRIMRAAEKQALKNGRMGWKWDVEVDESKPPQTTLPGVQ